MICATVDNGGTRLGFNRRQFSYNGHIPERRSGTDRRCRADRRSGADADRQNERRTVILTDTLFFEQ